MTIVDDNGSGKDNMTDINLIIWMIFVAGMLAWVIWDQKNNRDD